MSTKPKKIQYISALIIVSVGIIYILSHYGRLLLSVIFPFGVAAACAHFLSPVADFLSKNLKFPKGFSHIFVVLTFYAALFGVVYILTARLAGELSGISEYAASLPQYFEGFERFVGEKFGFLSFDGEKAGLLVDGFASFLSVFAQKLALFASGIVGDLISFVPNFLFSAVVTVVATCYFSKDLKKIKQFILYQLPPRAKVFLSACRVQFFSTTAKYIGAYLTLSALTFLELFSGLLLINGKFAFAPALFITLVDALPFVGCGIVLLPWSLFEWIFGSVGKGAALLALYLLVAVIRQIAEPKVLGAIIGLHPLITLFAVYAGAKIMGFRGIFLFPIAAITVKNLNDKGIVKIFNHPPDDKCEKISKARTKYKRYRKEEKK